MQHPVGEDVAPFRVGTQLDLVDRQEFHIDGQRHRLDRADEILRAGRDDLFLAGDQGDRSCAARSDDPVVNLAGQQSQRKADHARRVAEHPFDRQVGLAGVGRTQHRHQPGRGRARRAMAHSLNVGWRGESGKRRIGVLSWR